MWEERERENVKNNKIFTVNFSMLSLIFLIENLSVADITTAHLLSYRLLLLTSLTSSMYSQRD